MANGFFRVLLVLIHRQAFKLAFVRAVTNDDKSGIAMAQLLCPVIGVQIMREQTYIRAVDSERIVHAETLWLAQALRLWITTLTNRASSHSIKPSAVAVQTRLKATMKKILAGREDKSVFIRAPKRMLYGDVVEVVDA